MTSGESVRAVLMHGPGRPLEHVRIPAPRPRPGGAVLETVASEVCGTDVHLSHGRLSGVPYPIIPGHVNVGRVLEAKFQWAHARDLKPDPEELPKIEEKLKDGLPEETSSQAKAGKKSGDGG